MTHRSTTLLTVVALLVTSAAPATARQEPPAAKERAPQKEAGHDDGERIFNKFDVEVQLDDGWVKAERIGKPLLLYGDPTRNHDRGSVWGWGEKGRPVALVELFQHPDDRSRWVYVLCNTSGRKVRANMDGRPWWLENSSACELKDVPGSPPAAADAALRQRQLKLIASKFTGHQFWNPNNTRYDAAFRQVHGASYRQLIDLADWDRAVATSAPGQSGQPAAEHYADLAPLWAAGEYFPLAYTKAKVDAVARHRLTLTPGP